MINFKKKGNKDINKNASELRARWYSKTFIFYYFWYDPLKNILNINGYNIPIINICLIFRPTPVTKFII